MAHPFATVVPDETELDRFAAFVERGAIISGARWSCVEAEDNESERVFKPEGGLTEEHYRRLGNGHLERVQLARTVIEDLLRRRGHERRAIEAAFREIDDEAVPDLVEEYSFEVMAEAVEVRIRSPQPPSNAGPEKDSFERKGRRGIPDTSRTGTPDPVPFRGDHLPLALGRSSIASRPWR